MRTNDQTAQKILELIESDSGFCAYEPDQLLAELGKLPTQDQEFLNKLTEDDLGTVVCGESQTDTDGNTMWQVEGQWTRLPEKVEQFLESVFDGEA